MKKRGGGRRSFLSGKGFAKPLNDIADLIRNRVGVESKFGFTLAEILITLGIIGIVAAMTMPTLIQKHKEREYISKLKKFHTVMNQAFEMAKLQHGEIENWGLTRAGMGQAVTDEELEKEYNSRNKLIDIITSYIKTVSVCKMGETCEKYIRYTLDGTAYSTFSPRIVLADGTSILELTIIDGSCKGIRGTSKHLQNLCGELFVDLNGSNPPNTQGKDVFFFYFSKYGIIPVGTPSETHFDFKNYCDTSNYRIQNGYACTAWVIYNENMDYLHCNDLSWDGKEKCK